MKVDSSPILGPNVPSRPNRRRMRWVLGSMGPGTKLPSLGHTTYDNLKQTFALQAEGLIDGGADAFLVETSQDLLQTKAALAAIFERDFGRDVGFF